VNLAFIASLWTLTGHPPGREWPLERQFEAMADAGFDGVVGILTPRHATLAAQFGLKHLVGFVAARSASGAERAVRQQIHAGARSITVLLGNPQMPPALAAAAWAKLDALARRHGVSISLETHRDRCTETPEKIVAIAAAYRAATGRVLQLTFDFSHLAVARVLPLHRMSTVLPRSLIRRIEQLHLRPHNAHHAQLPARLRGRVTAETAAYLEAVTQFYRRWRSAVGREQRVLLVCPEVGPISSGYAVEGFDSPWADACFLKQQLQRLGRIVDADMRTPITPQRC